MSLTSPPVTPTAPPAIPARADDETFDDRADAAWAWLFAPFWTFIAAFRTWYDGTARPELTALQADVQAQALTATTQATAAAANAAAAAASAGASVWVSGTTYAAGVVRYSPTDIQTYRDTTGGLSNTDPASDTSGRWISAMLPSAEAIGLPDMLPTAVFNFAGGQIDRRFVQARATAKTRRNIFGNVESVAAGVALPDFHGVTKRCIGYRSEQAATYLDMQSTAMDNGAYWNQGNVTITPAAAVGIDGAMSAYKVEATTSATTNYNRAALATAAAQYFTLRAKKGSGATDCNNFAIYNTTAAALLADLTINYDTGAITQTTGTGATAVLDVQGYWCIRVPVTAGITIGDTLVFYVGFSGGPETAGEHAYIACVDVADKPNASHYPTSGSTFPRGADGLTLDLAAHTAIINPAGYTVVVAFDGSSVPSIGTDLHILALAGAGGSELARIAIINGATYAQAIAASANQAFLDLSAVVAGRNVVAFSVAADNFLAVAKGGTVQTSSSGLMPAVTQIGVGCVPGFTGTEFGSPIESVICYPRVCTAGELRALVNNF
ncbi:MAG: hypothetical protein KIS62_01235 [Ramlibacter sp.]|nr:hypothetical protein [Ramlibacter sp.]